MKTEVTPESLALLSPEAARQVLHELQLHRIELEVQNETLRRSQLEMETSRKRYLNLYDLSPVGNLTLNEQGMIQKANLSSADLLGMTREDLLRQRFTRFVFPLDKDIYYRYRKLLLQTGTPQVAQLRMIKKDGGSVWVRMEGTLVKHSDESLDCLLVVSNINELKITEERLRQAAALFESAREGVMVTDPETHILLVNQAFTTLTGYTQDEARGQTPRLLQSGHQDSAFYTAMWADIQATGYWRGEILNQRKSGEVCPQLLSISTVHDKQGQVTHYVGVVSDIPEPKQIEASLIRSAAIIDSSDDAIIGKTLDGTVTSWNRGAEQLFGYHEDEIVGKLITMLIPDEYLDDERLILERIRRGERVEHYETVRTHRDGRLIDISVTASPLLDAAGGIVGASSISRDITERKREEAIIVKAARYARSLIEASLDPLVTIDGEGKIRDVNLATEAATGCCRETLIGSDVSDYFTDPDQARAGYQKAFTEGRVTEYPLTIRHRSGRTIEVLFNASLYGNAEGVVEGVVATIHDVTERNQFEARLQLAASVFSHAREGIIITDAAGDIVDVNETFSRITGYPREEALGQNPRILKSGLHSQDYYESMWRELVTQGYWDGEIWNHRKNGEAYAELLTISAVRNGRGETQHYVALFSDITPFKEHQSELERIAHYDTLTSLPNRLLLADRMRQIIVQTQRRGGSLAVIYLDLDGFKAVNDQYGHTVGDQLLIAVAQRMTSALREGDTLARIGGDEFVAVMIDLEQPQDCVPVLNRLLKAAADPVQIGSVVLQVSASIGVTLYPQDGADGDQLLRHADQAMYVAKQAGKNRYHLFDLTQDAAARTHHANLARIRQALDQHEFVLYYQPKVNMKTGALIGAEALIRWQHPGDGLLRPAAFLPLVENHALGVELGDWVLDTALAQLAEWHAQGFDFPVSVNIGARQLQQDEFLPHLRERLAAYPEVAAAHLELEILESVALEDITQVSLIMQACREMGVRFAIDDFGTGYSSLTYLKRLPAEVIKIDQSFVRDMLDDPDDLSIVEGVIGLAVAFNRTVIAEGVETAAHGELLLPLGCELAQGYGIAHPMPATELPGWARTWRQDATWNASPTGATGRELLPVLFAMTHHRAWVRAFEACLASESPVSPPPVQKHCPFGAWLEGEGRVRWGNHPNFQSIAETHRCAHTLADELLALHASGGQAVARERLGELRDLRDALIDKLQAIILE